MQPMHIVGLDHAPVCGATGKLWSDTDWTAADAGPDFRRCGNCERELGSEGLERLAAERRQRMERRIAAEERRRRGRAANTGPQCAVCRRKRWHWISTDGHTLRPLCCCLGPGDPWLPEQPERDRDRFGERTAEAQRALDRHPSLRERFREIDRRAAGLRQRSRSVRTVAVEREGTHGRNATEGAP